MTKRLGKLLPALGLVILSSRLAGCGSGDGTCDRDFDSNAWRDADWGISRSRYCMRQDVLKQLVAPGTSSESVLANLGEPNAQFGPDRLGYTLGPRGGTGVEYYYLVVVLDPDTDTVVSAAVVAQ